MGQNDSGGEPFEWLGTGGELFKGFIAAFFLFLLPVLAAQQVGTMLAERGNLLGIFLSLAGSIGLIYLIGMGSYRAMRYRMFKTMWRGITGAQSERGWIYGLRFLGFAFLAFVTLGMTIPLMEARLWNYQFNRRFFGNKRFEASVRARSLYKWFAPLAVLQIGLLVVFVAVAMPIIGELPDASEDPIGSATLGAFFAVYAAIVVAWLFGWGWYQVMKYREAFAATRFGGLGFRFDVSAMRALGFVAANTLLLVVTVGLATPLVLARQARFMAENLEFTGQLDEDELRQGDAERPRYGEGLADALDLGGAI